MAINIDASRYRQCSASCCEILYSAETHPLEGTPWHLGVHLHSCPHQRHSIRHPFQELVPRSTVPEPMPHNSTAPELMSHSTALTPFLPGHQSTAIINRPIQPTDLRQIKPVLHQPSRCHRRRPYLSGRHLHRRLLQILVGASLPGHPKLYRHNTCLQASFRVRV